MKVNMVWQCVITCSSFWDILRIIETIKSVLPQINYLVTIFSYRFKGFSNKNMSAVGEHLFLFKNCQQRDVSTKFIWEVPIQVKLEGDSFRRLRARLCRRRRLLLQILTQISDLCLLGDHVALVRGNVSEIVVGVNVNPDPETWIET